MKQDKHHDAIPLAVKQDNAMKKARPAMKYRQLPA